MPLRFALLGSCAALGLSLHAIAQNPPNPDAAITELRETISKIVDTRALESKEKSDWAERKASMAALLDLHQRELSLLNEELEKAGQSAGDFDQRKKDAETEIARLRAARRAASEALHRNLPRTLQLISRFPTPLTQEAAPEIAFLRQWKTGEEPREAIQNLLGLIAKAEQFHHRITRTTDIRDQREVEVLYLGLTAAYYADRSGNAGTGQPGENGWNWSPNPSIHKEIIKAFDELDRKRPPEFVRLPLQISTEPAPAAR